MGDLEADFKGDSLAPIGHDINEVGWAVAT